MFRSGFKTLRPSWTKDKDSSSLPSTPSNGRSIANIERMDKERLKDRRIEYRPEPGELDTPCYICTYPTGKVRGYPVISVNNKQYKITRYLWELYIGPIPEGHVIRHKCDNPLCVNVKHLETGTTQENTRDRVERNRSAKGMYNGNSALSEDDVRAIRKSKEGNRVLANRYGVHISTISGIRNRKTWVHVKDEEDQELDE